MSLTPASTTVQDGLGLGVPLLSPDQQRTTDHDTTTKQPFSAQFANARRAAETDGTNDHTITSTSSMFKPQHPSAFSQALQSLDPSKYLYRWIYGHDPPCPIVSEREWIMLGPFVKWRQFGKPPFKFVSHLLMIIFMTIQVIYRANGLNDVTMTSQETWQHWLMTEGADWENGALRQPLYSVKETVDAMATVTSNYFTMINESVDALSLGPSIGKEMVNAPTLVLKRYEGSVLDKNVFKGKFAKRVETETITVSEQHPLGSLGDMTIEEWKNNIFAKLVDATVFLQVYEVDISEEMFRPLCLLWDIEINFDFTQRGGAVIQWLRFNSQSCSPESNQSSHVSLQWVTISLLICSTLSGILGIKSLGHSLQLYLKARRRLHRIPSDPRDRSSLNSFDSMSYKTRVKFFFAFLRSSDLFALVASSFSITFCLLDLSITLSRLRESYYTHALSLILGAAIFCAYFQIIFYLRFFPKFYELNLAVRTAVPGILRLFVGIMPIYFAFALTGLMWFGTYAVKFKTLRDSSVTLFGVLNGDEIIDTFNKIMNSSKLLGFMSQVYLYVFIGFFMYSVLSILVTILQESYEKVRIDIRREKQKRRRLERTLRRAARALVKSSGRSWKSKASRGTDKPVIFPKDIESGTLGQVSRDSDASHNVSPRASRNWHKLRQHVRQSSDEGMQQQHYPSSSSTSSSSSSDSDIFVTHYHTMGKDGRLHTPRKGTDGAEDDALDSDEERTRRLAQDKVLRALQKAEKAGSGNGVSPTIRGRSSDRRKSMPAISMHSPHNSQ